MKNILVFQIFMMNPPNHQDNLDLWELLFPVIMICPRLWLRINDNQIRICFEFRRVLPISVFLLLSTTSLYQGYTVHNNLSCSAAL